MKKKSNKIELQESIDMIFEKECGGGLRRLKAGRKIKPSVKKKAKSFTLSVEAQKALQDLQGDLSLPSQSAVVEFLILKAHRGREVAYDLHKADNT